MSNYSRFTRTKNPTLPNLTKFNCNYSDLLFPSSKLPAMVFVWVEITGHHNSVAEPSARQSMLSFLTFTISGKLNKDLSASWNIHSGNRPWDLDRPDFTILRTLLADVF